MIFLLSADVAESAVFSAGKTAGICDRYFGVLMCFFMCDSFGLLVV